jgi:hypothetical protein
MNETDEATKANVNSIDFALPSFLAFPPGVRGAASLTIGGNERWQEWR